MRGALLFLGCLSVVFAGSCQGPGVGGGADDGGGVGEPTSDGGEAVDAGDAQDSGAAADGGGLLDAGLGPDGGERPDAGLSPDGGQRGDAGGASDAGLPRDAGGVPPDAGVAACNSNAKCDIGERCDSCPGDCGACDGGAPCARLNKALANEVISISGDMGDDPKGENGLSCDVVAKVSGVTVTGSWTGDLRCRNCNGWLFKNLTVTSGSLRMIAGDKWTIKDSSIEGGGRGIMAVVGTGSVDGPTGHPTNWLIENITSRNAGCRPPNDPFPTHVRALYVIGHNGTPMNGVIRDSVFEGEGCGATVKIGGTGNFGSWSGAADAADGVTFEHNIVRNIGQGIEMEAVLLATNSDNVTITNNTLSSGEWAIVASGPWSGANLNVTNNLIQSPKFLLARVWNNPGAGAFAYLYGEKFLSYPVVGPCAGVGTCTGNTK